MIKKEKLGREMVVIGNVVYAIMYYVYQRTVIPYVVLTRLVQV